MPTSKWSHTLANMSAPWTNRNHCPLTNSTWQMSLAHPTCNSCFSSSTCAQTLAVIAPLITQFSIPSKSIGLSSLSMWPRKLLLGALTDLKVHTQWLSLLWSFRRLICTSLWLWLGSFIGVRRTDWMDMRPFRTLSSNSNMWRNSSQLSLLKTNIP